MKPGSGFFLASGHKKRRMNLSPLHATAALPSFSRRRAGGENAQKYKKEKKLRTRNFLCPHSISLLFLEKNDTSSNLGFRRHATMIVIFFGFFQVIQDLAASGGDSKFSFQTPPSSPSSLGSRKSSMCSISSAGKQLLCGKIMLS